MLMIFNWRINQTKVLTKFSYYTNDYDFSFL